MTEDEMVGRHHWLDGYEFEQAPGVGDGQGDLMCCRPWEGKEWDMTERLNWTEYLQLVLVIKNLSAKAGDLRDAGSITRLGRSPGGRYGNPLQHSCLENPMDRGAWWVTVHKVMKSWTRQKQFSTLACNIVYRVKWTDQDNLFEMGYFQKMVLQSLRKMAEII